MTHVWQLAPETPHSRAAANATRGRGFNFAVRLSGLTGGIRTLGVTQTGLNI